MSHHLPNRRMWPLPMPAIILCFESIYTHSIHHTHIRARKKICTFLQVSRSQFFSPNFLRSRCSGVENVGSLIAWVTFPSLETSDSSGVDRAEALPSTDHDETVFAKGVDDLEDALDELGEDNTLDELGEDDTLEEELSNSGDLVGSRFRGGGGRKDKIRV